jgi:hypothetical protein
VRTARDFPVLWVYIVIEFDASRGPIEEGGWRVEPKG